MSEQNENAAVSVEDLLIAEAQAEASKPPRTKKTVVLASLVEFINDPDRKTWMHVEQKYPSLSKASLKNYIRENNVLDGLVYPIQHDDFGLCVCKIS